MLQGWTWPWWRGVDKRRTWPEGKGPGGSTNPCLVPVICWQQVRAGVYETLGITPKAHIWNISQAARFIVTGDGDITGFKKRHLQNTIAVLPCSWLPEKNKPWPGSTPKTNGFCMLVIHYISRENESSSFRIILPINKQRENITTLAEVIKNQQQNFCLSVHRLKSDLQRH